MNIVLLVGRLTSDVEIRTVGEKEVATVTIACRRDFKNQQGLYDTDFIPVILWEGMAHFASEYCKKGMAINLRGRIIQRRKEMEDGTQFVYSEIYGESITFNPTNKEIAEE